MYTAFVQMAPYSSSKLTVDRRLEPVGALWIARSCLLVAALGLLIGAGPAPAQKDHAIPSPTYKDVPYGPHERNVLDLYLPDSSSPTPLAVFIHSGGFVRGSKEEIIKPGAPPPHWPATYAGNLKQLLAAGISVAAINYRLIQDAPLPAAHHDSRRALQFLRSKAGEWNFDQTRVAAFGGSAGAQVCMWLAFHDDMADPRNSDPIARESTRVDFVASRGGLTTMDGTWARRHIAGYDLPQRGEQDFGTDDSKRIELLIADLSALSLISAGDPPIFMQFKMKPDSKKPPGQRAALSWMVHHVAYGVQLKEQADKLGVEAHLMYPSKKAAFDTIADFLIDKLQ